MLRSGRRGTKAGGSLPLPARCSEINFVGQIGYDQLANGTIPVPPAKTH
jgi:hypothetical protein